MKRRWPIRLALMASVAFSTGALAADADADKDAPRADEIVVHGMRADEAIESTTGLPLTLKQTPQSVTVIDRQRIKDFALTNTNDVLQQAVGIDVQRNETDRTTYTARGFDITSFQVDGIGLPQLYGIQSGDLDTVLFERVETIRGANGMMTGVGNPSATINYVRKRPTRELHAEVTGQIGSWGERRIEADVSAPLTHSGDVQGRLIYAHEESDSYLDHYRLNRDVYAGLLSWDVTPQLKATIGYSRQENHSDGVLWGALPLTYSDGSRIPYARSASTSADWTYWNVTDERAFAEIAYRFANDWSLKGVYTRHLFQERAKLLYAFGYPDPETGLGVYGMSGVYPSTYRQRLFDVYAEGPVKLFGREHRLALGVSAGNRRGLEYENFSEETIVYPDVLTLGDVALPEPEYPGDVEQTRTREKLIRAYVAAHVNVSDRLKGVVGATAAKLKVSGVSYNADQGRNDSRLSPYAGALYDVTPNVTLYANYTAIFNPQIEVDATGRRLAPAIGSSYEAGVKGEWFDKKLYATAAVFRAKQKGLADRAGEFGEDDPNGRAGDSFYRGLDTVSKGIELEVAGYITNWMVSGGFTAFSLKDDRGERARTFVPTRMLKLATTYTIPQLHDLKLGGQLRWQNRTSYADPGLQDAEGNDVVVRQRGYAVVDLLAGIDIVERVNATLNVRNVGNAKYLNSLNWGQAFYAAPRSATLSIGYAY